MEPHERNPFQCGRPIPDPAGFFGRETELRRLAGFLSQLHWVSIVGPRRIGKTSLLLQLCHPGRAAALGLAQPGDAVVMVNAQGLQSLDAAGWYTLLVGRAAEALGAGPPGEVRNGFQFQEELRRTLAGDGGRRLILLLDEFDDLAVNPHLDADFFGSLRALSTSHPVAFVTASRLPLIELTYRDRSVLGSPFFNPFVTLRLGLLEEAAARALLGRPEAGLAAEAVDFLTELAGLHPLFLQYAGYFACDRLRAGRWDATAAGEIRRELAEAVAPHLRYAWEHLSPAARQALITLPLARGGEAGLDELRGACLLRAGGYLSPLVESFARRQAVPGVLAAGDLWADLRRRQAVWRRQPLALTDLAFGVLCYLLERPGQPAGWAQLERGVWGQLEALPPDYQGNPERVDAAVDRLRKALREAGAGNPISVRGGAYCLEPGLL